MQTLLHVPIADQGRPDLDPDSYLQRAGAQLRDELDVLVAFNEYAYQAHKDEVSDTGVIIYNSEEVDLEPDGKSFGMPFDELARSTGNARAAEHGRDGRARLSR